MRSPQQEPATPRPWLRPPSRPGDWLLVLLVVLVVVLAIALFFALQDDDEEPPLVEAGLGVTLDEVSDNPTDYFQRRVIVSGEVGEVLTPYAFTLGDGGVIVVSDRSIRQLAGDGVTADALEESIVQVDGLVTAFDLERLETELGVDLEPDAFEEREGSPTIVARSVLVNPSVERAVEEQLPEPDRAGGLVRPGVLSVADVRANFDQFEGEMVTVAGEVGTGIGPHVALLDGLLYDTEDLLMVTAGEAPGAFPQRIPARVTGIVRALDIEAIEDELDVDLDDELVGDLEGEPAILADAIVYVVARLNAVQVLPSIVGERVVLSAEVTEVLAADVFTVQDGDVLVIARDDGSDPVPGGTAIAEGTVTLFRLEDAEAVAGRELAELLDPEEWEGRPVVVADRVEVIR